MSAFFEHLRENLGIKEEESPTEAESALKEIPQAPLAPKQKKLVKRISRPSAKKSGAAPDPKPSPFASWEKQKGELGIDVYETENEFVIQGPIAGVALKDINVSIEDDMVTIVGNRENPDRAKKLYRMQECYWGGFSRQVLLPDDVDAEQPRVSMNNGILTVRFLKKMRQGTKQIIVETT